ncbi:MAG: sigma 54-interacting transcriptional regulator [Lachnospiraceae bacterium]|nr:sigma 54-interacting transcriptional regulator [Lachnospiraceae bacterium]
MKTELRRETAWQKTDPGGEQFLLDNISDKGSAAKVMDVIWNSNYPAYVLGSDGQFMFVNNAFVDYTENPRKKWLGLNVRSIRHTFNPSIYEQVMKTRTSASIFQDTMIVTGRNYHQITMGIPMFGDDGSISHILAIVFPLVNELGIWKASPQPETGRPKEPVFIMNSAPMRRLVSIAGKAADTNSSILISGETGTGKGALAQFIHSLSARKDRPFNAINCAELTDNLIESELFGYEAGSFTGPRSPGRSALSRPLTAERSSLTKSIRSPCRPRGSCCACWNPTRSEKSDRIRRNWWISG